MTKTSKLTSIFEEHEAVDLFEWFIENNYKIIIFNVKYRLNFSQNNVLPLDL